MAEDLETKRPKTEAEGEEEEQGAEKKRKVTDAGDEEVSGDAPAASEAATVAAAEPKPPVKIGYRTFKTGKEAFDYFHHIFVNFRKFQNLNDVSGHVLIPAIERRPLRTFPMHACMYVW